METNLSSQQESDTELESLLEPLRANQPSELQLYRWKKAVTQEVSFHKKRRPYQMWISAAVFLFFGFWGGWLFKTLFIQQTTTQPNMLMATCSLPSFHSIAKNTPSFATTQIDYIKIR